jgi:hypothetical protein
VLVVTDVPARLIKQTAGLRRAGMWLRENAAKGFSPTGVFRGLAAIKAAYSYNPVRRWFSLFPIFIFLYHFILYFICIKYFIFLFQ